MRGRAVSLAIIVLALLVPAGIMVYGPERLVGHDVRIFFFESAWVAGGPALYTEVFSEYPLAANLIFATVREAADRLQPASTPLAGFAMVWMTLGWWAWLAVLAAIGRLGRPGSIWLWLTPTSVYFTVLHFDIVPVACTFAALVLARGGRTRSAALLLGLAIAVKGYALFAVPAFAVWLLLTRGPREALLGVVIAVGPLAASIGIVALLSDVETAVLPFRWQALRGPNGEGLWDALGNLTGGWTVRLVTDVPLLPFALATVTSIIAAAMRPRTADELCRAFVVAIGGYALFSIFYSAQFALWLIPPIALGGGRALLVAGVAFQWVTFAYAPVASHLPARLAWIHGVGLEVMTLARAAVVAVAFVLPKRRRTTVPMPATVRG